jgi:hypothetical protein
MRTGRAAEVVVHHLQNNVEQRAAMVRVDRPGLPGTRAELTGAGTGNAPAKADEPAGRIAEGTWTEG